LSIIGDGGAGSSHKGDLSSALIWQSLSEPGDQLSGLLSRSRQPQLLLDDLPLRDVTGTWGRLIVEQGYEEFLPHLPSAVRRMRLRFATNDLQSMIEKAADHGFQPRLVADFPFLSNQFADLGLSAPIVLWLAGSSDCLNTPALGVVGSRISSGYGRSVASGVISLMSSDYSVVSGGALGIDTAAHRAAMQFGIPTIAYMAGGPDRLYPAANQTLFSEMIRRGGAIVAESPPGTPPGRWRFLQRNRLIAAHSKVLLVAEAGYRSGARNTAGIARVLGRAVYAAPGQIDSASSNGCNRMIADNRADCLVDIADPVRLLTGADSQQTQMIDIDSDSELLRARDALELEPLSLIELATASGLDTKVLQRKLHELVTCGHATCSAEGWALIPNATTSLAIQKTT